jgi:hypothetical protein
MVNVLVPSITKKCENIQSLARFCSIVFWQKFPSKTIVLVSLPSNNIYKSSKKQLFVVSVKNVFWNEVSKQSSQRNQTQTLVLQKQTFRGSKTKK